MGRDLLANRLVYRGAPGAAWVVLLMLAASPAVLPAAPNLIKNGDFEQGPSGTYPGVGLYWETNDGQAHSDVDFLSSTRHGGSYAQWLKANPVWDLGAVRQVSGYNKVTGGQTYHIQAWIKTASVYNPAGWYVFGIWWFQGDTWIADSKMPQPTTNNYDWRLVTWDAVAPANATRVAAILTRHTDGDAWYDDIFVGEITSGTPQIAVTPTLFEHRVARTGNLGPDRLTVQNIGNGLLNYRISSNATWLSIESDTGSGAGEIDTASIQYNASSLPLGEHSAVITVADTADPTLSQAVTVHLVVFQPGDCDGDGDVDQEDFGTFQVCISGDQAQTEPGCVCALMNADTYVDATDLELWTRCFTAPGVPAEPQCAGD